MSLGYYSIKKPTKKKAGGRASFAIEHHVPNQPIKRLALPELVQLNKDLKAGVLSGEQVLRQIKALVARLYAERDKDKAKLAFSDANLKVVNDYWAKVYLTRKTKLVDPYTMFCDLKRAAQAAGPLSLRVASQEELQVYLDRTLSDDTSKHRRVVARLNSILKFLNRDFQLDKMPEAFRDLRYLTDDQITSMLGHCKDKTFALLCRVAFGTGMRLGEIFAIKPTSLRANGSCVYVDRQLDGIHKIRSTKTRKPRTAWILKPYRKDVASWAALDPDSKKPYRNGDHAARIGRLCLKAKLPECVFHDLRHSYAVYLLGKGAPLKQVAESLGNSQSVCEKYYGGYVLTSYGLELLEKL